MKIRETSNGRKMSRGFFKTAIRVGTKAVPMAALRSSRSPKAAANFMRVCEWWENGGKNEVEFFHGSKRTWPCGHKTVRCDKRVKLVHHGKPWLDCFVFKGPAQRENGRASVAMTQPRADNYRHLKSRVQAKCSLLSMSS